MVVIAGGDDDVNRVTFRVRIGVMPLVIEYGKYDDRGLMCD